MEKNTLGTLLALGLVAGSTGCTMDTGDESQEGEDIAVVEEAIMAGVGVQKCSGGEDPVHATTAAGNLIIKRDVNGTILSISPIACSSMGIAAMSGQNLWEVAASAALKGFGGGTVTCGACLAFQGPLGPMPPGTGGTMSYRSRISYPSTVISLGNKNSPPVSTYYFGNSWVSALTMDTSWCDMSTPTWGRLTNAYGYELVSGASGSEWGTNAYQMWDPASLTLRTAAVDASGILKAVPWVDACQ
jgi:hypothetical protein